MLRKLLRKKIVKIIPVWLIILMVAIPAVSAVAMYLSNTINQSIAVVAMPITLANGFDANMITGSTSENTFSYSISSSAVGVSALTTGYLKLTIIGDSSPPDVSIATLTATPNLGGGATLQFVKLTSFSNTKVYYYGATSTTAYNFGASNSVSGTIFMRWQLNNGAGSTFQAFMEIIPSIPT
jgi:hypothetical protein